MVHGGFGNMKHIHDHKDYDNGGFNSNIKRVSFIFKRRWSQTIPNKTGTQLIKFPLDAPTSWDSLRKQARNLEAELDSQMHMYHRLVSTKADDGNDNTLGSSIEQLLKQLQQVISQMQAWVSSGALEIFSHTLTRHCEIHCDLTQELNRLCSSLRAKREHALLIEDFREFDKVRFDVEEGSGSEEQSLLKERANLMRSTGQMDGVISQAQETLRSLVFQRSSFRSVNSKVNNVSSRLPTVNSIISTINKKKSMDSIILSLVASICMFLIRFTGRQSSKVSLIVLRWLQKMWL
ncbi:hypothetical protein R6Q59_011298 [Mikania micrantha]